MNLKDLRVCDILFDHTEHNFVSESIQTITKSRWNHVKTVHRIVEQTPDGIFIAEAIAEGYKERSLRESTGANDIETRVCRYCADGVGGNELTNGQIKMIVQWDDEKLALGLSYGFPQIAALALLKLMQNDSVEGMFLGKKLEDIELNIKQFFPSMICSESVYRKFYESGIDLVVIKDSAHLSHYQQGGNVLDAYICQGKDLLNPVIADWVSPHDVFEAERVIDLDSLEYDWR